MEGSEYNELHSSQATTALLPVVLAGMIMTIMKGAVFRPERDLDYRISKTLIPKYGANEIE
jgi:hypothetical protein